MAVTRLTDVVTGGLCSGCGICASIAGHAGVEMALSPVGQLRPRVPPDLDPALERLAVDACPGATIIGPRPARGVPVHPVWGPVAALHRAWAADEAVRFHAAAGGTLTALGRFLLEAGEVDAVLHVRASASRPMHTDAVVSTTPDEVLAGAQSRYGPAAPLVHVRRLLDEGRRFAVVAKPCDLNAVRNLARRDPRVDAQVPFLLTIFCGGVPSVRMAEQMAAHHGLGPQDVARFRFRGEGWPGPTRVEAHDGRAYDLSYDEAYYAQGAPWRYDMQWRCKTCPDAIGEVADVACPDGWLLDEAGRPAHHEAPGVNLAIARTPRGAALLERASAAGALVLAPLALEEVTVLHADHLPRKLEHPARRAALLLTGQPRPYVRRYRTLRTLRLAGARRTLRALAGTVRRVRRGANREPSVA
ncbi:MAG: Coenzyme F420 hydrogenase/dehydrogenase, beta subunit C-terminal domain [Actinomycetota bacterium]|nr:Coenzyme F420 hydrogenase/dehydrogenase, beta subunit C-terminal domain [Actinomycetota bacterium]